MPASNYKFGEFELDCARFELRRDGRVLKLEHIPMELLILLAEKDGNLVSRQEIIERLWGTDAFVDTEHGINTAIRKVRMALREDAEQPRFVQTVPGKGYRFVVAPNDGNAAPLPQEVRTPAAPEIVRFEATPAKTPSRSHSAWRAIAITMVALFLVAGLGLGLNLGRLRDRLFAKHQIGPIHSIAVLPLVNLSGDPSQEYFADGMTDELITALAKNRSLRVVSRTSAMQYKGVSRPLSAIAQELGVDGILEGSVARSTNHVHMTVQLIYAPTDTHMWAESYDRDLNGALSLPQELSQIIASESNVSSALPRPQRAISVEAHDAYLLGRYFWYGFNFDRSKEYFEKAIQLQPDYAAAWAGLADTYGGPAVGGLAPPRDGMERFRAAARKAVELDDSSAEGHASIAAWYFFYDWDWKRADEESARAIELDPNYVAAHHLRSYILTVLHRYAEALQEQKRATEIDPVAEPWALAEDYFHQRQYEPAIEQLRVGAEVEPANSYEHYVLSQIYELKGMSAESVQEEENGIRIDEGEKAATAFRQAFARGGEKGAAQWRVEAIQARSHKGYVSPRDMAYEYALLEQKLGRKNETLKYLEAAYRERSPQLVFVQNEPAFDFLHSDDRYRAIVKNMGLMPTY